MPNSDNSKKTKQLQEDLDKLNLLFIEIQQKHKYVLKYEITKSDITYNNIFAVLDINDIN